MRHLDQLCRKCRHAPNMGGNTETITLPCTLVVRLIEMAQAWQYVNPANLTDIINSMAQQKARADRLEKLLREIANAGVFITCDTSRGIMARIEAELGA